MTPRFSRIVQFLVVCLVLMAIASIAPHQLHSDYSTIFVGMTLVVPNAGEVVALAAFLNKTAATNPILKLYKSNTTPAETDTAGTYTESTFTGYAAITLTGSSWTVTGGAPTTGAYAQQTFTSSADQTLENAYGYFVVGTTSGTLLWSERFAAAPYAITNNGDAIQITPQITLE